MLYKRLIINGTEYFLAVAQSGKGAPTAATEGSVGVSYMDEDTGVLYKCTGAAGGVYTWEPMGAGGSGEDGGYYTPGVSKLNETTVQFEFTPSKSGMPAVAPVTVELPVTDSSQNVNPVEKTEDMTQPVGVDENGRLWTAPTSGASEGEVIALSGWTYGYVMEDGTFMASGTGCTSDYVPIFKGKIYTIKYPDSISAVRFAIYDSSKNFSKRIIDGTAVYTAVADGYMRITAIDESGSQNPADYADVYLTVISGNTCGKYWFLNGLKYYAFGDSIVDMQGTLTAPETFGDTGYSKDLQNRDISGITVEGYVTAIERRYGLVATNYGKGGHTLVGDYATLAALDYSDVALVTIAYGVNDARTGVPLGTVNSTDISTFAGAMNNLLRKIYTDNPECRVVILTPIQRLYVSDFGIGTANSNGNYLVDFVDMCKKIAAKRSTKCIDMYRDCGINQTNLYYYTVEGVHPVNQGFARMKGEVIPVLDEMFSMEFEPFGVMNNAGDTETEEPDTGGDAGGEEPPVEDPTGTVVDISDQFTVEGIDMDGYGTGKNKTECQTARYKPVAGKTYTLSTYCSVGTTDYRGYGTTFGYFKSDGTTAGNKIASAVSGLTASAAAASSEGTVTIDGTEVQKLKVVFTTASTLDGEKWINIGCLDSCIDAVELSYV